MKPRLTSIVALLRPDHLAALADLVLCLSAGVTAFLLRFEFAVPPRIRALAPLVLLIWLVVKAVVFRMAALQRFSWRHVSTPELRRIVQANVAASVVSVVIILAIYGRAFPRSLPLLDLIVSIGYIAGARAVVRLASERAPSSPKKQTRVFIYGAGKLGVSLLRDVQQNPALGLAVSGFVDDNPQLHGAYVYGVRVLGSGSDLKRLAVQHPAEQVVVAVVNASASQMTSILENCSAAGLACRILPSIAEALEGRASSYAIRNISVEDLLGRKKVSLDQKAIAQTITGKTVLVTGAAGSIGSELCRQIARHSPKLIVGYEAAETPLFFLDKEMKERLEPVPFEPVIGNVQDRQRLAEVIQRFRPAVVYHAAAYKHVPMMEANPFEGVANNIFGTESVLQVAQEHGVASFIMISTDKAVRPTNVMGTSKRIAELLVNAFSTDRMRCVSVRFGNVLGSNGSVIPIFQQQIAAGGPVTVTHPEMRRYFMTIPEASQLVLQASAIGKSGEILVLDMGEPVKIVDLATNMIRLAGLQPGVDMEVRFTGIRPGEKLYEELNLGDESLVPTSFDGIRVFKGPAWERRDMQQQLARIRVAWESRDVPGLLRCMKEAVPEYNPNRAHVADSAAEDSRGQVWSVTLLGALDRKLDATLLEHSNVLVKLALREAVPLNAAIRVERAEDIELAEIWACEGDGDGHVAIARIKHRLPRHAGQETALGAFV